MLLNGEGGGGGGGGSNGMRMSLHECCMVAVPEMCLFCFDVLYAELYNLDSPAPHFSTDDA